ncbi:MAG TPA: hypothetical protein VKG44_03040 [Candidatus Baltobacteraceae bacterium]|nr:hypothetical protein [Candidatus Baltobacteraceae bacterium]
MLTLRSEVAARAILADRPLVLRLLRPPYPALGVGTLRVLRVSEAEGLTEIVAGYDRYERLEKP